VRPRYLARPWRADDGRSAAEVLLAYTGSASRPTGGPAIHEVSRTAVEGILAGLAISAPVGPVNVLCISRTISNGWRAGVGAGLGAAAAGHDIWRHRRLQHPFRDRVSRSRGVLIRFFRWNSAEGIGVVYYRKKPKLLAPGNSKKNMLDISG